MVALVLLELFRPDIMLLDLQMPMMSGLGVVRAIQGHYCETTISVLTISTEAEYRAECLKLGAAHFLLKDDRGKLVELLNELQQAV